MDKRDRIMLLIRVGFELVLLAVGIGVLYIGSSMAIYIVGESSSKLALFVVGVSIGIVYNPIRLELWDLLSDLIYDKVYKNHQ